jgi:hypothetical protein
MTAFNFEQARFNMIEQQIRPWDVLDQRALDTLAQHRRVRISYPSVTAIWRSAMSLSRWVTANSC